MTYNGSTGLNDEADLQRMSAERQIYNTVVRYCRGIDRHDRDLVLSCYHPGAIDNHGVYIGNAIGFVDESVELAWRTYEVLFHYIGNHLVDFVSDDLAHSEAYVIAHHVRSRQASEARLDLVYGRYVDDFERRDGAWKIANRVFVHELSETRTIDTRWKADARFARGIPAPLDLAYRGAAAAG
jgi:SnoaL-like domain